MATDAGCLSFEKSFTLSVNDVSEIGASIVYPVGGQGKPKGSKDADIFSFNVLSIFGKMFLAISLNLMHR